MNERGYKKFEDLYNILHCLKPLWDKSDEYSKSFIETTIGASIFYLPTNKTTFSGYISEQASQLDKKLWVKEHQFPRKITASMLFQSLPKTINELIHIFNTQYGIWNYVTKKENSLLKKYQKSSEFKNPTESYELANIKLIKYPL